VKVVAAAVLVSLASAMAGCGSHTTTRTPPAQTAAGGAEPYQLYTHCGIRWARIHGTIWQATPPLSDGNGNPPPGWENPYQPGMLTIESSTTAEFNSSAGSVRFRRTKLKRVPMTCS
jgi:hypothetical protein